MSIKQHQESSYAYITWTNFSQLQNHSLSWRNSTVTSTKRRHGSCVLPSPIASKKQSSWYKTTIHRLHKHDCSFNWNVTRICDTSHVVYMQNTCTAFTSTKQQKLPPSWHSNKVLKVSANILSSWLFYDRLRSRAMWQIWFLAIGGRPKSDRCFCRDGWGERSCPRRA